MWGFFMTFILAQNGPFLFIINEIHMLTREL